MRSKIPDSKSRAQPNARAVNMSRTTVESALVMHAAPSYKEYRKIAEIANIPLSLSEEQYEYAISKRKKASHRFAWAFAVAREMYMVSQPDYLEYGHIEVLGEELIAAHKAVYGESMHHREYEKVACRRSETFQKAYEKSRRSYAVLVAWKIEKPITEFETTRCPVTSNVNYREIDVIDLTVSPTHERISIPGQHTIPAVSQIRAEQTPTTEPLRQPNQCSTINKQSTAGKPSTVKKQSTGKQPIVNKQPVVNGLSTVKYRQQLKEICRQYSRPWTSGNTSNALPSETSSQSVGDDLPSLSEMREQSTSTTRSPRTSAGRNKARVISNLIKEINRPETPYTPQTLIKCTDPNTPRSAIGKTLPGVHPAPHGLVSPPKTPQTPKSHHLKLSLKRMRAETNDEESTRGVQASKRTRLDDNSIEELAALKEQVQSLTTCQNQVLREQQRLYEDYEQLREGYKKLRVDHEQLKGDHDRLKICQKRFSRAAGAC